MYKIEKLYGKMEMGEYIKEYVNIEEFIEYCKECECYNKKWSCPEYRFNVTEYWEKFKYINIIGNKIIFNDDVLEIERTDEELKEFMKQVLEKEKQKLAEILYEIESKYLGSISLSAGSCHLCHVCERIYERPCKYPDKMRYSMESLGANVGKTCSKLLRVELLWAEENKLPKYFVLISCLLSNDEYVDFYV